MDSKFIILYRRALRHLQDGSYTYEEEDKLRKSAFKQEKRIEDVILNDTAKGEAYLAKHLRECIGEQNYAWTMTHHVSDEILAVSLKGGRPTIDDEMPRSLYYVLDDALCVLIEIFSTYFPCELSTVAIGTDRGPYPMSILIEKFGSPRVKKALSRQLKTAIPDTSPAPISKLPEAIVIEEYLSPRCSIDLCDKAAKKVELSVGNGAKTFPSLRIHSLAEALLDTYSIRAKKGTIGLVRLGLAQRYGINDYTADYNPQHNKSRSGRNEQWDSFYDEAKTFLNEQYRLEGNNQRLR